jgi:dTDP-4-dehydrorhamnose 3,5-epimerase
MKIQDLAIPDVKLIVPNRIEDARGFFSEIYRQDRLAAAGIEVDFVQENHSLSVQQGVIRGLHFQVPPHPQGKLVKCVRGAMFDVAVDIRTGSPTFGKHVSAILSEGNGWQLWVPVGFAHGFCTLEPNTEVVYKVTNYYSPQCDRGLAFDDGAIGVDWPTLTTGPVLSDRDRRHPKLSDIGSPFAATHA